MSRILSLVLPFFLLQILLAFSTFAQRVIVVRVQKPVAIGDSLFIAGSQNGWNSHDTFYLFSRVDSVTFVISIPNTQSEFECKITRGSWKRVEVSENGQGIQNRKIDFGHSDTLTLTVSAWQDCFETIPIHTTAGKNVSVWRTNFFMPQFKRTRAIRVYLPPDYATSGKRYPVIFMHDGQNLFDVLTSYSGEWGVDEALDSLNAKFGLSCIVVGIDNGGDFRIEELTPWRNAEMNLGGKGDLYAQFVVETLKPAIDSAFRPIPEPKSTFVGGSSLGGLISLYIAAKYPNKIGGAIVFSPSIWFSDTIYSWLSSCRINSMQRFYFYGGQPESATMVSDMLKVVAVLKKSGLIKSKFVVSTSKDGRHNEQYWKREFPVAAKWLIR